MAEPGDESPALPNAPLEPPGLPQTADEPPDHGTVLVVAPHPDDETLGPGGTLALHARRGDPVHVVFVTTGVHGDPDKQHDPDHYIALRRAEAEQAARLLGIAETTFWGFPDSCVVTEHDLANLTSMVSDVFERLQPAVVYAPHPGESHSDHYFVARAAERAHRTHRERGGAARLLGYEVWSPLEPTLLVDVTPVYEVKRAAIHAYPSQLEHTDIEGATEGLNRYRSILLPTADRFGGSRAEAFLEMP